MAICFRYAFCTGRGGITENVFASPNDAEMWASQALRDYVGVEEMPAEVRESLLREVE